MRTVLLDLGNYNIKLTNNVSFISPYVEFDGVDTTEKNVLEYEGKKFAMEYEADFDAEFNKVNKAYMPNLLWGMHKYGVKDGEELRVFLQLPLSNLGQADALKNDLLDKSFTFTTDTTRTVHIKDVVIIGEGMAAFYTLPGEVREKDLIVIDIGGRTTNVVEYRNGRKHEAETVNIGTINLYNDIKVRFNNENGQNVETYEIAHYIKRNIVPQYSDIEDKFVNTLMNRIKGKINMGLGKTIVLTGGGSITLRLALERYNKEFMYMDNPVFANINGAERIAKLKGWI